MSKTFHVEMIKPSHYDDEGYVIQWWKASIPSNSLASLFAIVQAAAENHPLGPDVTITFDGWDECNSVISVDRVAKRIQAAGAGIVFLVGVQSNQFPRAVDLGRTFRARGIDVVIGGFHVSGCLSMLDGLPPTCRRRWTSASRSMPGRRRSGWRRCCRTPTPAH